MAAAAADSDSDSDSDSDWDYSSDRLGGVRRQLRCPLCRGYFRDPMVASCGDSFCHVCISRAWERCRDSFPCPVCRAASPEIRLRPNRQLRNAAESAQSRAARTVRKVHRAPIDRLSIERSPEREPCRSGFPLFEEATSRCPGHREPLVKFCSQDERPQHRGHDFPRIQNAFQTYPFRSDSPVLWEPLCRPHKKHPDALKASLRPANVTLDPDTAHPRLVLSEDGKREGGTETWKPRPDTPERFDTRL